MTIYTRSRKQAAMAEDLENPTEYMKLSRNLRKAMMRNIVKGDSLKKDLKSIQGERNKLMHPWEQRKLAFAQQIFGKRPVLRWSGEDMERRDKKEKVSKHIMNSEGYRRSGVRERSELSLQHFTETSRRDTDKDICTVHGDKKVNTCMPKLTVKDLSRILCPSLSDTKDIKCRGIASPNTSSHRLNRQFSNLFITKEPTIRHDSFSPACSSRSVVQRRPCYRTLSLSPSELSQTRERKKIDTSPNIELRKRAATWSPRQSMTLASDQNDSASKNQLHQVCSKSCGNRMNLLVHFLIYGHE